MNIAGKIKARRNVITIILATAGIGIMLLYATCETTCSYLQGDILGIDLMYIGIGYMLVIIILAAFKQMAYVRALLAAGIGVEAYLIAFQFKEDVFCPYCLTFASIIIMAFILNHERPLIEEYGMLKQIIYGLGEAEFIPAANVRVPLLFFVLLGYIFIVLTFSGSATPAYGAEKSMVPSYGHGKYEMIIFTDYFCPPCQLLESEIDPALTEPRPTRCPGVACDLRHRRADHRDTPADPPAHRSGRSAIPERRQPRAEARSGADPAPSGAAAVRRETDARTDTRGRSRSCRALPMGSRPRGSARPRWSARC